ncbi:hypothetical protein HAX54_008132, partial [Datura stramonium]|nr:hypothetical protein [Datura stramonium]
MIALKKQVNETLIGFLEGQELLVVELGVTILEEIRWFKMISYGVHSVWTVEASGAFAGTFQWPL